MALERPSGTEVLKQLERAELAQWLDPETIETGPISLVATAQLRMITALRAHPSFKEGLFYGLHTEVGDRLADFRGFREAFGPGSLQLVIDTHTGRCYADVDCWSPYEDVVSLFGHTGEVLRNWWRRWRAT